MHFQKVLITTLLISAVPVWLNAQPDKINKEQAGYMGSYESKTLSPANTPILLPYNRWIDPTGSQIYFGNPDDENHALDVSLSPDEKWLAVEGRYEITIVSPLTEKIVASLSLNDVIKNRNLMSTFSGICWIQEGDQYRLFWSVVGNADTSYVLQAMWDNSKLTASGFIPFEAVPPASTALPNEILALKEEDREFLYVVLNGNNSVVKIDLATREKIWTSLVGVAPFGIVKANGKLYVTNWAGNIPDRDDPDVAGVPWGSAKVDQQNGSTREGTVSVLDPKTGVVMKEIQVGLHPNDIAAGHDGKYVFIACANSDVVNTVSTLTDQLTETISVRLSPEMNPYWGDSPNGLTLSRSDHILYVANGMDNAVAVVSLGQKSSANSGEKESRVKGFIPTGAYPGAVSVSDKGKLFVANIEAEGAHIPSYQDGSSTPSYNSHRMMASVSVIPVPGEKELKLYTKRVEISNQLFRLALTAKMPRELAGPVPVPERIGEPSLFKHVLYIIRENRTYDQVLGDLKKGDGDSSLTIFGRQITPNAHQLCNQFMLLDNFYVSGKCSAEGHQWTDASIVTDYIEKDIRAWIRSYPHVQEDALVYAPTGFIWDNALKHGKTVRIYGEASTPHYDLQDTWTSIYNGFLKNEKFEFNNTTTIKPVEKILSNNYPASDDLQIPDVLRAETFIQELKAYEEMEGDQLPELMVMALSGDHTVGTRPGMPTPRAKVADNDLALGQIVEAVTMSRFWNNTVIFVTEDDSQSGWDHVSAYRTVGLVLSPYSRSGEIIHTNYNQPSMVRTIEQILGIPPMNIMDATAKPMFDCFASHADLTPYKAVGNLIPLNEMNPPLITLKGTALHFAQKSMEPQFDGIDKGDDILFNHILWFSMKGKERYPKRFSGEDDDK
jgi:DNA-binding beta-propeller fold protein YncE